MGPTAPFVTCNRYDTLQRALELFAAAGSCCERLICVDEQGRCTGVVALSDIFAHFAQPGPISWRSGASAEGSLSRGSASAAPLQGSEVGGGGAEGAGSSSDGGIGLPI